MIKNSFIYFIIMYIVLSLTIYLNILPKGIFGVIPILMLLGYTFEFIGNSFPFIKIFLGGGPVITIFFSALMVHYHILPQYVIDEIQYVIKDYGVLDVYIAALISGSILGMDSSLLKKTYFKYLLIILGAILFSILFTILGAYLLKFNIFYAIFYITLPILSGGIGSGAIPLSKIFSTVITEHPINTLLLITPPIVLGNFFSIIFSGFLRKFSKKYSFFSGHGKIYKKQDFPILPPPNINHINYKDFGIGLTISIIVFFVGLVFSQFIPLHSYVFMILTILLIKIFNIFPKHYEICANSWYHFVMKNFTTATLAGLGMTYVNISSILNILSFEYLSLIFISVFGSLIGASLFSYFCNFYILEGTIAGGLCMSNFADVAVLNSANLIELMPYAQISTRIGGSFIIIIASIFSEFILYAF